MQLYTQVEAFAAAISKLQELGFKVNTEESELVYRGAAGETQSCSGRFFFFASAVDAGIVLLALRADQLW